MGQVKSVEACETKVLDQKLNEQKILDDMIDDAVALINAESRLDTAALNNGYEIDDYDDNRHVFKCRHCKKLIVRDSEEHNSCITDIEEGDCDDWFCEDCHEFCPRSADETEELLPKCVILVSDETEELLPNNDKCNSSIDTDLIEPIDQEVMDKWTEAFVKRISLEIEGITQKTSTIFPFMEPSQSVEESEAAKLCRDEFLNKQDERVRMIGVSMDKYSSKQQYMYRHSDGEIYTFWMKNNNIIFLQKYIHVDDDINNELELSDDDEPSITFPFVNYDLTVATGAGLHTDESI
jgi:hypothetical protein